MENNDLKIIRETQKIEFWYNGNAYTYEANLFEALLFRHDNEGNYLIYSKNNCSQEATEILDALKKGTKLISFKKAKRKVLTKV